ncbi:hypothetical protein EDB80DRAFT_458199 [Ilyonectria destructans]|nr:hypothetical protein EDB80DRAFT_458199 [Ilyonectria destructans]
MSTLSLPRSSITATSLDTTCHLITSLCAVFDSSPDIRGLPTKPCLNHGVPTPPPSLNEHATYLAVPHPETKSDADQHNDFDRAYQRYGRAAHMGILDPSYKLFTSQRGYGALLYKIESHTVIVTGDPLCAPDNFGELLEELSQFRSKLGLGIAFMGMSETFAEYARECNWATLHFGRERVVNPLTNPVLLKGAGKRMISQTRQLLDQKRGGVTLYLYSPSTMHSDPLLQIELQQLYDGWRKERNCSHGANSQAFVTVYDLFSRPDVTLFLYTKDRDGCVNGLAALRCLGANNGFHLDPCVASSTAPRGITDLLVITAMKLLAKAGIDYLSLGYEPFSDLRNVSGQTGLQAWMTQSGYRRAMQSVSVHGKAAYYNKFRPDDEQCSNLYIVIPPGGLHIYQSIALMHIANLRMRSFFP